MIDFHSHIIPGVDDGSKDIDMTVDMLSNAKNEGTELICATPHYIADEFEISRKDYDEILEVVKKKYPHINILTGLELYINPNIPELYKQKKIWGINDTRYLLIELPMREFPVYTEDIFYELRLLGALPIIAHPERNLAIIKNEELLVNLIEQGTIVQMNSGSLTGLYGSYVKKFADNLLSKNMVHILGSDGHNNEKRKTDIKQAFDIIKKENEYLFNCILNNEKKIVQNKDIEIPDIKKIKRKRSFFHIFG